MWKSAAHDYQKCAPVRDLAPTSKVLAPSSTQRRPLEASSQTRPPAIGGAGDRFCTTPETRPHYGALHVVQRQVRFSGRSVRMMARRRCLRGCRRHPGGQVHADYVEFKVATHNRLLLTPCCCRRRRARTIAPHSSPAA